MTWPSFRFIRLGEDSCATRRTGMRRKTPSPSMADQFTALRLCPRNEPHSSTGFGKRYQKKEKPERNTVCGNKTTMAIGLMGALNSRSRQPTRFAEQSRRMGNVELDSRTTRTSLLPFPIPIPLPPPSDGEGEMFLCRVFIHALLPRYGRTDSYEYNTAASKLSCGSTCPSVSYGSYVFQGGILEDFFWLSGRCRPGPNSHDLKPTRAKCDLTK